MKENKDNGNQNFAGQPNNEVASEQNSADSAEKLQADALDGEKGAEMAAIEEKSRLLEEQIDRYKRLQADFDNFRRRTRQEKEELSAVIVQGMILELLPVLDNFQRALSVAATQEEAASLFSGVEMIYRQFNAALEKNGLTPLEAVGKAFDPQQHQAVMRVEDDTQIDGTIVEELQKGYAVKGRIIRPSMVKVVGN